MRKENCLKGILVGKPAGMYQFEYLGVDGRIILKWILNKLDKLEYSCLQRE